MLVRLLYAEGPGEEEQKVLLNGGVCVFRDSLLYLCEALMAAPSTGQALLALLARLYSLELLTRKEQTGQTEQGHGSNQSH